MRQCFKYGSTWLTVAKIAVDCEEICNFVAMNDDTEIKELLQMVESRFGCSLVTPHDYIQLQSVINGSSSGFISVSTLKRLYGYVPSDHVPSYQSLSVLARYVGFRDWMAFLRRNDESTSGSLNGEIVTTSELRVGDCLELEWLPNRLCRLRYLGDSRFVVEEVHGSHRLAIGDTMQVQVLCVGQPMIATNVMRDGQPLPVYVAGRKHGISNIKISRSLN